MSRGFRKKAIRNIYQLSKAKKSIRKKAEKVKNFKIHRLPTRKNIDKAETRFADCAKSQFSGMVITKKCGNLESFSELGVIF